MVKKDDYINNNIKATAPNYLFCSYGHYRNSVIKNAVGQKSERDALKTGQKKHRPLK